MADQKPMTVADVRAMLSGKPADSPKPADAPKPVEPAKKVDALVQSAAETNVRSILAAADSDAQAAANTTKPAAKSLKTNEKGG